LSKIDILLVIIVAIGAWSGYREGFLMELFSVLALVLGLLGAFKLMGLGVEYLERNMNMDKTMLPYISFAIIFFVILGLVTWLGRRLRSSIDKSFLGKVDQWMGLALGAFKTLFVLSILLWIVDSFKVKLPDDYTAGSWLYPFTARLAPEVAAWLAGFVPFFREIFRQF
jgi:membrane protein required for colicin V production